MRPGREDIKGSLFNIKKRGKIMKKVTRRFYTTMISPAKVYSENGQIHTEELDAFIVSGKIDSKQAMKEVQKEYGKDNQYVIIDLHYEDQLYMMSVEKFIENAEVVSE